MDVDLRKMERALARSNRTVEFIELALGSASVTSTEARRIRSALNQALTNRILTMSDEDVAWLPSPNVAVEPDPEFEPNIILHCRRFDRIALFRAARLDSDQIMYSLCRNVRHATFRRVVSSFREWDPERLKRMRRCKTCSRYAHNANLTWGMLRAGPRPDAETT